MERVICIKLVLKQYLCIGKGTYTYLNHKQAKDGLKPLLFDDHVLILEPTNLLSKKNLSTSKTLFNYGKNLMLRFIRNQD
eukprot:13777788-Ditylum_brightwellii.AAC.1